MTYYQVFCHATYYLKSKDCSRTTVTPIWIGYVEVCEINVSINIIYNYYSTCNSSEDNNFALY
jgi:hypothetical protein